MSKLVICQSLKTEAGEKPIWLWHAAAIFGSAKVKKKSQKRPCLILAAGTVLGFYPTLKNWLALNY